MFDVIVFTQDELIKAVQVGYSSICLCDNAFTVPLVENKSYIAVGEVTVKAEFTYAEAINNNISFEGFKPEFLPPNFGGMYRSHSLISSYRSMSISSSGSGIHTSVEYYNGTWVNGYGISSI